MKWLPREKRNLFIIVVLSTAAILALIYFGLICSQKATLFQVAAGRKSAGDKLADMATTIKNADLTAKDLVDVTRDLSHAQDDMASGDLYSWTYGTMRLFKQQYKVEIPDIGHPEVGDVSLLPSFPYKQLRFSINGKAYFHDLGKFVADFENAFPHARIVNLVMEPAGTDTEQLSFRMDIIVLVKSNNS